MGHADKIRLTMSEVRKTAAKARAKLAEIVGAAEPSAEQVTQRDALVVELRESAETDGKLESQLQAAIELDASEQRAAKDEADEKRANPEDDEKREKRDPVAPPAVPREVLEFRSLNERVQVGNYLDRVIQHRGHLVDGAEAELRQALHLGDSDIPWGAVTPSRDEERQALRAAGVEEHRVDAVTATPASIQAEQERILARVFATTAATFLGMQMDSVALGSGDKLYYVITTGAPGAFADAGAAVDATAAVLTPTTLKPRALQAAYLLKREDLARVSNLESRLRADLRGAMSDALDRNILNGDADFLGLLRALDNPAAGASAVISFPTGASAIAGNVDGKHAQTSMDIKAVVGVATYNKLVGVFQTNDSDSLAAYLMKNTGGLRANANIPAPATFSGETNNQRVIVARTRATDGPNLVCPMWGGITVSRDDTSVGVSRARHVSIQFDALYAVAVLREDAFEELTVKVA